LQTNFELSFQIPYEELRHLVPLPRYHDITPARVPDELLGFGRREAPHKATSGPGIDHQLEEVQ
jgi:hypothetical protein